MQCKHFGECGSCRLYENGYDFQLKLKSEEIKKRFSGIYNGEIRQYASRRSHYRSRAEFKVWHVGDEMHYAMNARNHKGVVLIEECPMVIEPIADLMWKLLERIKSAGLGRKLFGVDFLGTKKGEIVVSMLYHRRLDEVWESIAREVALEFGIGIIGRSRKQKLVIGKDYVTETLHVRDNAYRFQQIENSFTQPNAGVNEQMVSWALEQFEDSHGDLLELYCGAGNFTIPLASVFKRVLATEISKASINAAKVNMQLNGVDNIEFVRMSAEEFVQALDGIREFRRMKDIDINSYDITSLFVDPPRAGLDEESCRFASRFENLLYISCNPETLARDMKYLLKTHRIEAMAMFDQFPYTSHMEMGVRMLKCV